MLDERTNIIINEINYWKQHKLLPDVYCDYLLALYSQGEDTEKLIRKNKNKVFKITQIVITSLLILMLLLSLSLVYLIEIENMWQTILLITIIIFSSWMYILLRKNNDFSFHFGIVILLTIYFISSIHISTLYIKNQWLIYLILFLNLFGWFYISQRKQLKYLKVVSTISIVFTVFYIISHYFAT